MRKFLIALSVGLNIAFITLWALHAYPTGNAAHIDSLYGPAHTQAPSLLHRSVNATPEQWRAIEPHVRDFQEAARSTREDMKELRRKMLHLLAEPVVDEKAIHSTKQEILAHQERMKNLVINFLLKEKEILEPEQFKALLDAIQRRCNSCGDNEGPGMMSRVLGNDAP
ncbi:Spy/CpxP family protein refolding chaperone [Oceanidesulfovibrio indonesiensis]|uniref:Spy/CpxP family protein refolding chaperone n=1 Tax=Oceanidesulfovibrio indonesiensis TaxID=54767 RepID=UPI0014300ECD|nr:periplasmic heavy metal sensor [Oceanidesulfovibrio indonesiensis]